MIATGLTALLLGLGASGMEDPVGDLISASMDTDSSHELIRCRGEHRQGAILVCRTEPGAQVSLGDISVHSDADGWVVLGHDRDASPETMLRVTAPDRTRHEQAIEVEQREYVIQRIDGLPPAMVTPAPETLERIRREGRIKAAAYTSRWEGAGFAEGFQWPATGRITGVYGSQRILNGEPRRPHYGLDIAAPTGTPVTAPASGVVTLADPDMYYEGGLIFIDHGQGFTGVFMHLDSVDVNVGDVVAQGQHIGTIGATGRVTGAHLDWRIKWHDRYIDPEDVLELDLTGLR